MLSLLKKIFLVIFLRHVDGFKGEHKQPEYLKLQAFFLSSCNFQHTIYLYIYICVCDFKTYQKIFWFLF